MIINASVESNIGNIRSINEDNYYCNGLVLNDETRNRPSFSGFICDEYIQIYAVSDGMGGESHGERASKIAVDTLFKYQNLLNELNCPDIEKYTQMYINEVTTCIAELQKEYNSRIGTTLALIIAVNNTIYAFNIGDSRIYVHNNGKLMQISEDHTPAVRAYKLGMIKEEEIKTHPHRNKLTQYLGVPAEELTLVPTKSVHNPVIGERILLCSDGISDMLSDEDISHILSANENTENAVHMLVNHALENGGRDNITAIVLDIEYADIAAEDSF